MLTYRQDGEKEEMKMTRTFTYTFTRVNGEKVTLKKRVTDKMEEINCRKAGYAAVYFNEVLRSKYGYKKSVVTAARIKEI